MSKHQDLLDTVEKYQSLAAENYTRIRNLADEIDRGMCAYMSSSTGDCVHLVPPMGQFEPKAYGEAAFSMPPRGFRPLGPIAFGLAIRVTPGTDWLRVTLECRKEGEDFIVQIVGGEEYRTQVPLADHDPEPLYKLIYRHVFDWFGDRIQRYVEGDYGTREIGFDFADDVDASVA